MKTVLTIVPALIATVALAQSYNIDWSTIDGGGGTSSGGTYAINGTIGQPDAGVMSGGNYSLVGGFWGVLQTPAAPLLSITRPTAGTVSVSWTSPAPGWVLDQATTLPGTSSGTPAPWTLVPFPYVTNATTISITVPAPTGTRFYRLRQP